jgi:signal transduction histidine kinase/DNA-binding response OmpR family regulator/ligand-binding sensor domain-containing protein
VKSKIFLVLLILTFNHFRFLLAAGETIKIVDYSYEEGLTTSGVNSVFRDSRGFLWICSNSGLFRYDGYSFENVNNFGNVNFKYGTLSIAEDKNQNFWIGTDGKGVVYYNIHTGKFLKLKLSEGSNSNVNHILFFQHKIWLATNIGLLAIDDNVDVNSNSVIDAKVLLPDPRYKTLQMNVINYIYAQHGSKSLWVGTNSFLYELNTQTLSFRFINSYNQNSIRWLSDYNGGIIAASWDGGVFAVNPQTHKLGNDTFINDINKVIGNKRVMSVVLDNKKRCWLATYADGLYIFEKTSVGGVSYENYRSDGIKPKKLKSNFINQLYLDKDGIVWLSMAGLSKVYFQKNDFHYFDLQQSVNKTKFDEILAVNPSADKDKLWINFNGNEIGLFDTRNYKFKQYTGNSSGLRLQNDKVSLCYQDRNGNLWIVYQRIGLYVVPAKDILPLLRGRATATVKPIDANRLLTTNWKTNSYITAFFEDSKGRLWIGAWGSLYVVELKKDFSFAQSSDNLISESHTKCVYIDVFPNQVNFPISPVNAISELGKNKYLLATRGAGIIELDETSNMEFSGKEFFINNKLPGTNIKCIYKDKEQGLWIGTNSGLCYLNRNTDKLRIIKVKDGLSSDDISGITEDVTHNIWLSTSYGIYKVNPEDFSVLNFFNTENEKLNQYITNAATVTLNGGVFFSTNEALVMFDPDSVKVNKINDMVYFTDIRINNKTISPLEKFKGTEIIGNDINESKVVNVPYRYSLSIAFATLDFLAPEQISYKYKIGNNNEWILLSPGQRSLTLPNMSQGEYTLSIMVANSTGNNIRSIRINYLPPFWLSKTAYVVYFIVVMVILITYRRLLIQKVLQKSIIEKERFERKKLEELDKMKSEFFSNISHEFRTPLSLIINPLEKLAKEEEISNKNKGKIKLILKSSNRLLKLTNELMDFSKIEKNLLVPDFQFCEIVSFINELCQPFNNLADSMNIDFKVNCSLEQLGIPIDKGMIEKVIFNLLSNAFKYTFESGMIMVNITEGLEDEREFVKISFINTGEGIHKENLNKVFDRYYQVNNVQNRNVEGTGIGLALVKSFVELHNGKVEVKSEPNLETCFDIYLPVAQDNFGGGREVNTVTTTLNTFRHNPEKTGSIPGAQLEYRLLIIEDEEDIRNYIVDELSTEFKILSAKDGEEGLRIANEIIPDLIITDVMMPGLSGVDLCKILKNQVVTSHIPILILSARTTVDQQIEGLEMGADVYMVKPFNIDHLKAQILRLISFKQSAYSRYLKETALIPQDSITNKFDEEFMKKVMDFLDKNLTNSDLNVDQLASCVSLSKVQTYRKIKAISGLSIVEFIRAIRLKKAAQLVKEGHLNFSEIAFETGFSTPSYFSKCFHDHFGKTPSEFASDYRDN